MNRLRRFLNWLNWIIGLDRKPYKVPLYRAVPVVPDRCSGVCADCPWPDWGCRKDLQLYIVFQQADDETTEQFYARIDEHFCGKESE